jgi:Tfp pilus assembly protein PilN
VSLRLGLELGPKVIRAVYLTGWKQSRVRTLEVHWNPADPEEAIAALGESLGRTRRLAVAVDLSFLFAKQVNLPPLPPAEKRRVLSLEPERFFPVRGEELVMATRVEDNLVFAARASLLGNWLTALEALGEVELVEPSPVSLARAVGRVVPTEATILMEEAQEGIGIAEIKAGRVRRVRRIRSDPVELASAVAAAADGTAPIYLRPLNGSQEWHPAGSGAPAADPLPTISGVAPPYLAAYGAALGLGGQLDEALLSTELRGRITGRRRRSRVFAGLAATLGVLFALLSLDGFRSRTLRKLETEIAQVRDAALGVLALKSLGDTLEQEARMVAAMGTGRPDPVAAFAALTRRLPPGAYLTALRASGSDWQIDGYAREAAPLVPRLEEDPLFSDVHFLTATSRTRLNRQVYESFSIALRLVPPT